MVTESQILIDYIPIFLTIFGIVFFFLYLKTKADKEAFEYSYNVARDEINIRDIRISELRREVTKCQEDYSKAKAKIKKLNRKLENMNAEHIISSSTTDSIDSSNKTQYSNSDTYNGVSRYKMKKFINDHRTSKFASSMPSNSELDSLDIMSLYMYYTLLDNVLSDDNNKDSSNTTDTTDYPINEESETETTNSESEPSIIDKAVDTINDITSPITTPVMGVVNEAFETRDKMIDTTFGTLNEINNAKNEAIMNAASPVIDKAAEIRDSVIDGVSNTVEKIKEEAVELNHSVDNIEEISSDSESKSTYEDYESNSSSSSSDSSDYSSSSSSSDNDDSYSSSSSSSYWDSDSSSSDYSSSSSSSSYDSDSSWSSSSSWDSGSSSFDSGSSGGDW